MLKSKLLSGRLFSIVILFALCSGVWAAGVGDVQIRLNNGANKAYIGAPNRLEIWIKNDLPLRAHSLAFSMSCANAFFFVRPYGNKPASLPIVHEEVGATGEYNLQVDTGHLPDTVAISFQESDSTTSLPQHATYTFCYSFDFKIPVGTPVVGGVCLDNVVIPPSGTWTFDDGTPYAPTFQGQPNSSQSIPDASPVCFDITYFPYGCGDANGDHKTGISDAVFLINYIFAGGAAPSPTRANGDSNGDCVVNISDAVFLVEYTFGGGAAPHCPDSFCWY
jgi:hypothetical protein